MKKNKFKTPVRTKTKNKRLIKKYPWLQPKIDWYWGNKKPKWQKDWDSTWLDDLPIGWRKAWGNLICEDIHEVLKRTNQINDYTIVQIKSKYGGLRWYDNGDKTGEVQDIIRKYEHISDRTCELCGKFPAPVIDNGWIICLCEDCYKKIYKRSTLEAYKKYMVDNSEFDPIAISLRYHKNEKGDFETVTIEYDTSDIVNRMRK